MQSIIIYLLIIFCCVDAYAASPNAGIEASIGFGSRAPTAPILVGATSALIDLSPIESDMAIAFDCVDLYDTGDPQTSGSADGQCDDNPDTAVDIRPQLAEQPVTTTTCAATSAATLRTCLATGGQRITLADGTYNDGSAWTITEDDTLIEAINPGGAQILGSVTISAVARVRLDGVRIGPIPAATDQTLLINNYTDVTLANVELDYTGVLDSSSIICQSTSSAPCTRLTVFDSFFSTNRQTLITQRNTSLNQSFDFIFVGNHIVSDYAVTGNPSEQAVRLMSTARVLFWGNYIEHSSSTPKAMYRAHHETSRHLLEANVFCNRSEDSIYMLWFRPSSTNSAAEDGDIESMYVLNNHFYDLDTTPLSAHPWALENTVGPAPHYVVRDVFYGGNTYYSSDDRVFAPRITGESPPTPVVLSTNFGEPSTACPATTGYGTTY